MQTSPRKLWRSWGDAVLARVSMPIRSTITFEGRVQGVGFRATTRDIADGFAVAGFVRNQADGSVLCVIEGEGGEIDRFLNEVRRTMAGCIEGEDMHESPATGEFDGFGVRR